jgi:hypothetical protein
MKTAQLKQKLHDYIDTAEVRKLKALYIIWESEIEAKIKDVPTEKAKERAIQSLKK